MADSSTPVLAEQQAQEEQQLEKVDDRQKRDAELIGEFWGSLGPLHPPEQCEQITPDGVVLKHVLVEGTGDKPKLFARCLGGVLTTHNTRTCLPKSSYILHATDVTPPTTTLVTPAEQRLCIMHPNQNSYGPNPGYERLSRPLPCP